jgi:antitoxin YefM
MYGKAYISWDASEEGYSMTVLTATQAREQLFELTRKSVKGHMPIKIRAKAGDVVLISEDDYESLLETLELLSTPGLRESIREARADIKAGRTKSLEEVFGR